MDIDKCIAGLRSELVYDPTNFDLMLILADALEELGDREHEFLRWIVRYKIKPLYSINKYSEKSHSSIWKEISHRPKDNRFYRGEYYDYYIPCDFYIPTNIFIHLPKYDMEIEDFDGLIYIIRHKHSVEFRCANPRLVAYSYLYQAWLKQQY